MVPAHKAMQPSHDARPQSQPSHGTCPQNQPSHGDHPQSHDPPYRIWYVFLTPVTVATPAIAVSLIAVAGSPACCKANDVDGHKRCKNGQHHECHYLQGWKFRIETSCNVFKVQSGVTCSGLLWSILDGATPYSFSVQCVCRGGGSLLPRLTAGWCPCHPTASSQARVLAHDIRDPSNPVWAEHLLAAIINELSLFG